MKKTLWASIAIILISFILGIVLYSYMPQKMASHWNTQGEVNGYMPKFWGLFLVPLISIGLFLLLYFIPQLDPFKENVKKFRKHYDNFILITLIFLLYIHLLTLLWSLNFKFNMVIMLIPALAILFYNVGAIMEKAKRNWFIGIRTPWTLSSDLVWEKTHKLGGKLFKISAIFSLLGILLPKLAIFFIMVPLISASIYIIIYSYVEYKKSIKNENKPNKKSSNKKRKLKR